MQETVSLRKRLLSVGPDWCLRWQVTRVYLCIHKRQILGGISRGIQKIDIADMERSAKESTDTLEHQVLFDNVNKVRKLNISVSFSCCESTASIKY